MLINTFKSDLEGCAFKAGRRKAITRSVHDAEVEDIVGVLNYLDTSSVLSLVEFAVGSLDRLPGLYGPDDINTCTVVDRQVKLDSIVTDLSATVAAFTAVDSSASSVLGGVTAAVEKLDERLRVVTGEMQDQFNQLATTCGKLTENIIFTPVVNGLVDKVDTLQSSIQAQLDQLTAACTVVASSESRSRLQSQQSAAILTVAHGSIIGCSIGTTRCRSIVEYRCVWSQRKQRQR